MKLLEKIYNWLRGFSKVEYKVPLRTCPRKLPISREGIIKLTKKVSELPINDFFFDIYSYTVEIENIEEVLQEVIKKQESQSFIDVDYLVYHDSKEIKVNIIHTIYSLGLDNNLWKFSFITDVTYHSIFYTKITDSILHEIIDTITDYLSDIINVMDFNKMLKIPLTCKLLHELPRINERKISGFSKTYGDDWIYTKVMNYLQEEFIYDHPVVLVDGMDIINNEKKKTQSSIHCILKYNTWSIGGQIKELPYVNIKVMNMEVPIILLLLIDGFESMIKTLNIRPYNVFTITDKEVIRDNFVCVKLNDQLYISFDHDFYNDKEIISVVGALTMVITSETTLTGFNSSNYWKSRLSEWVSGEGTISNSSDIYDLFSTVIKSKAKNDKEFGEILNSMHKNCLKLIISEDSVSKYSHDLPDIPEENEVLKDKVDSNATLNEVM